MTSVNDIASLQSFKAKAQKLIAERNTFLKKSIQTEINDKGVMEATNQLKSVSDYFIASSNIVGNTVVISGIDTTPIDKHIAYVEFGTGFVGRGQGYIGKLPAIWNYASGTHIDPATGVWVYKKQHDTGDQRKGGRYSTRGQVAKHPMWNTRDYIKLNLLVFAYKGAVDYLTTII